MHPRGADARRAQKGMTLIEILVVLAIFGLILYTAASSFGAAGQAEVVRSTNQLANTIRFAFDRSRVKGMHHRLAIDLDKGVITLEQADEAMYLPATNRDGEAIEYDESFEKQKADRDIRVAEIFNQSIQGQVLSQNGGQPDDPYAVGPREVPRRKPPLFNGFERAGEIKGFEEPIELPEDVKISYVRTDVDPKPIKKGMAYLYFFPQGRTQMAHIHLEDPDHDTAYTIKVQPLTGKVTVEDGLEELELPEDFLGGEDDRGEKRQRRTF